MAETKLKVIVKAKELMKHTYILTSNANRYPKKFRHSLVDRMQIVSMDIYEFLLESNRINNQIEKRIRCETITKAIMNCDKLLTYIELSKELEILNPKSAQYWSNMVSDVKYMAIAWRTAEKK